MRPSEPASPEKETRRQAAAPPAVPVVEESAEPADEGHEVAALPFDVWGRLRSLAGSQGWLREGAAAAPEGTEAGSDQEEAEPAGAGVGGADAGGGEDALAAPVADSMTRPAYPEAERRLGREGTVYLRVLVASSGAVERVVVAESSGRESFDEAAREAAERWRFSPARRGERPISAWVMVPVEFRLEDLE